VYHVLSITELSELDPLPIKELELLPSEFKETKPEKSSLPDLMKKKNEFIENFYSFKNYGNNYFLQILLIIIHLKQII
jgi:hypothetical protein